MPSNADGFMHEDAARFRDALSYTASKTDFSPRLIEKDYICSLILREFDALFDNGLIFKGGTALGKVHAGFYRLSEDLDFMISIESNAPRSKRSLMVAPIKQHLQQIAGRLPWLQEFDGTKAANQCTHYTAAFRYLSCISGDRETVRIEIGLREPLVEAPETALAKAILLDPVTEKPALDPIRVTVMSRRESYAEKIRAALTRRDPAIRDVYDLDYASQAGVINLAEESLVQLARQKLRIPGNPPPSMSAARLDAFRRQVEAQLRPVLRSEDFAKFDLERAFDVLRQLERQLRGPEP